VKFAVEEPAATVKEESTLAELVLSDDSSTNRPPVGAGPSRVTVPVELVPPTTDVALRDSELRVGVWIVNC
jgi:hypothetical protein